MTINNPSINGYSHQVIKEKLGQFASMVYWCMCDEVGENGTYHTHVFMALDNASAFNTVQKRFKGAHIELAQGTSQQNRDYIRKEGKWEKDKKKETNLPETFEEYGEMPHERPGARTDLTDLYDMIRSGMSDFEILDECPQYMFNMDKVERARQIVRENKFKNSFRQLEVTYVFGATGTGKTRGVMEQYGYENVYRVTDYLHPFDGYKGQDIIVFEEFRSSLRVEDMLNYLDGYPLTLPSRYNNKVACYTKVFIITNIDLNEQYIGVQKEHYETYSAFIRRIHSVKKYTDMGVSVYSDVNDYVNGFKSLKNGEYVPFD